MYPDKAFDYIQSDILSKVMHDKGYDQSTCIIKPCISYLTNRKQRVTHKVTNTISSKRVSNVGVPLRTRCNRKQWNLFSNTLRIFNLLA